MICQKISKEIPGTESQRAVGSVKFVSSQQKVTQVFWMVQYVTQSAFSFIKSCWTQLWRHPSILSALVISFMAFCIPKKYFSHAFGFLLIGANLGSVFFLGADVVIISSSSLLCLGQAWVAEPKASQFGWGTGNSVLLLAQMNVQWNQITA